MPVPLFLAEKNSTATFHPIKILASVGKFEKCLSVFDDDLFIIPLYKKFGIGNEKERERETSDSSLSLVNQIRRKTPLSFWTRPVDCLVLKSKFARQDNTLSFGCVCS